MAFIALISTRTTASTFYLLQVAPVFYLGGGVFLDHLSRIEWKLRPQWLMPAALVVVILLGGMPTLVSQYRNGRRFEFRAVAQWLEPQLSGADAVYSDQHMVMRHYLKGRDVGKLRPKPDSLQATLRELEAGGGRGALWIVAPQPAHAFRTNLKAGGLADWMYQNCQLRNTFGTGRLDFRQQYLQVYRCPPSTAPPAVAAVPPRP
jgi:hypothetical protein